ncbi:CapA family protein [Corallococcus sp. AB050B]|nr:CapA family protein [Corallococcus sp. AB050B]
MAPPSVLLMLALAAPVPNFSTAQSSSTARLTDAGMASVRSVIRDAGAGRLEAAGLASVKRAMGDSGTTVAMRMPAGMAQAPATDTVPATGAPQSQTESLSEAGRVAVEASLAALRAAALAMHGDAAASGLAAVGNPDEHYARGVAALQSKDSRTAITELSACVQAAPSRADCRWELGWAYSVEGRWADSLTQWTQVRALNPNQPDLEGALTQARNQAALQARLAQPVDSTPRPPPPPGAKLRIRAAGDLMLGTTVPEGYLPPEGGGSVIAAVRPLLEDADLTFVNLEGPLCDTGKTTKCRSPANCYAFRSPTSFGDSLKEAGVDVVSTANNHSGDFGEECRRATESTLDALGIAWSGPPGSVATVERNGLKIGLVAFHTSAGCNHLNNLPTATALVKQTAATHDIVIVSFHGGAEGGKALHVPQGKEMFFGEDRGDLRVFTHAVVDAGAHLVLGHGPHVARAMEFYQGRLIAYSMGNFATYGRFNLKGPQGLGMILEVELDANGRFSNGRILPTKQVGEGITWPDPDANVVSLVRKLTTEDFPETGARIADDGRLSPRKSPVTASSTAP